MDQVSGVDIDRLAEWMDGEGLGAGAVISNIESLGGGDHEAVGLSDFGKAEGFLERQVPRWRAHLESYNQFPEYPGPDIPGVDKVGDWIDRNRPAHFQPGIIHGDFHLANVLFAPD